MSTPELSKTSSAPPPESTWHSEDYVDYYDQLTSAGRRKDGQALVERLNMAAGQVATGAAIPVQPSAAEAAVIDNYRAYLEARRGAPVPGSISLEVLSPAVVEKLFIICNPPE